MRAPVLGGNFGVWGGLFSTFDCAVKGIRKKEDPYNAIIAGFFTGGSLAVRGGYKAARNGAIGCAVLLAVIEGVGIAFQRMLAGSTKLEVSRANEPLTRPWSNVQDSNHITLMTGTTTATSERPGLGMNDGILRRILGYAKTRKEEKTSSVECRHLSAPLSYVSPAHATGTTAPVFDTEMKWTRSSHRSRGLGRCIMHVV